jgi:hypothetical protein
MKTIEDFGKPLVTPTGLTHEQETGVVAYRNGLIECATPWINRPEGPVRTVALSGLQNSYFALCGAIAVGGGGGATHAGGGSH